MIKTQTPSGINGASPEKVYAHIAPSNLFFITHESGFEKGFVFLGTFSCERAAMERIETLLHLRFTQKCVKKCK